MEMVRTRREVISSDLLISSADLLMTSASGSLRGRRCLLLDIRELPCLRVAERV